MIDSVSPGVSTRLCASHAAVVTNIVAAFRSRIDALAWMTPGTKANAKAKLASLRVGVGYPDFWQDYTALEVRVDDALGNHLRAE